MHMHNQTEPRTYGDALRNPTAVWDELIASLEATRIRSLSPGWSIELEISMDEILADLAYGRE